MNETFIIRDIQAGDFPQISEVWMLCDLDNPARGDNESVINRTLELGGKFLVLVENASQRIVGTSWITSDGRRLYLHHFGIHPHYQHKGLGKRLTEASLAFARSTGLQIKLEVHRENTAARRLYLGAGFSMLGNYDVMIIRDYKTFKD
jgi:ribosomal protein S18 acetylase RimI-like enzyme